MNFLSAVRRNLSDLNYIEGLRRAFDDRPLHFDVGAESLTAGEPEPPIDAEATEGEPEPDKPTLKKPSGKREISDNQLDGLGNL